MGFGIVEFFLLALFVLQYCYYNLAVRRQIVSQAQSVQLENKIYLILSFVFLSFLAVFRAETVGNDTITYFNDYQRFSPFSGDTIYEPGFELLYSVTKLVFRSPYAIIATSGLVTMILFFDFIKRNSKWTFLSVMLFVLLSFFDAGMNIVRQAIAVGITCYSIRYIQLKRLYKFIVCVLLAMMFHYSALLFLPVWWLFRMKASRKNILIIVGVIIFCYIAFSQMFTVLGLIFAKYTHYEDNIFGEGAKLGALFKTAIYVFLLVLVWFSKLIMKTEKFNSLKLDGLIILCIIGAGIQFLSYNMSVVQRLAIYFNIFQIILIPNVLIALKPYNKLIITTIVLIAANLYYWTILIFRPSWNEVYPYTTFLLK